MYPSMSPKPKEYDSKLRSFLKSAKAFTLPPVLFSRGSLPYSFVSWNASDRAHFDHGIEAMMIGT